VNGDEDDRLTPDQLLALFDLWQMDINSVPFKHADAEFWTRMNVEVPR